MKAARYYSKDKPLTVEQVDAPGLLPGSVIVRVEAAFVPPFIEGVLYGDHPMSLPPIPFTPGFDAVGVIEEVAEGISGVHVGDKVYCNHAFSTQGEFHSDDAIFIGNFGYEAHSSELLKAWPNGAYAERVLLPAQCVMPLQEASRHSAANLCRLGWLGTAYGALKRAEIRPHHTLVINGATGLVGGSAVTLALALGLPRIVAVGRNSETLATLKSLAPQRVVTVCLGEVEERLLGQSIIDASNGGADIVLDAASAPTPESAIAAFSSLRKGGSMALVSDSTIVLPIPYSVMVDRGIKMVGSSWFTQSDIAEVVGLIRSGVLDIEQFQAKACSLDGINEAMQEASSGTRGLNHVAILN